MPSVSSSSPTWIWTDSHGEGRNRFAVLRRVIDLPCLAERAELCCFVDNRYRLRLNGVVLGHGPARFVPAHPLFDRYDLRHLLKPGKQVLTLECWSPGGSNFQAMPESRGGALVWGQIQAGSTCIDLSDVSQWRAQAADAWEVEAPAFSFAQGAIEICDTRKVPTAWFTDPNACGDWAVPTPLSSSDTWGTPAPRLMPMASEARHIPQSVTMLATLADDEERHVVRVHGGGDRKSRNFWVAYTACVHSDRAQNIEIGLFWGDTWLNGNKVSATNHPFLGNRQQATVDLQAGWNLIYGEANILGETWGVSVVVPKQDGLRVHAYPDAPAGTIGVGSALLRPDLHALRGELPANVAEVTRLQPLALAVCGLDSPTIPARHCAWDHIDTVLLTDAGISFPIGLPATQSSVIQFDCGGEVLGRTEIRIDAPAGTVVDIALDERRRSDGLLGIYASSPFTDGADRFICRGGDQLLQAFHPRGGRYLQVHLRPPVGSSAKSVQVHSVAIRSAQIPVTTVGNFHSADPVFDWTFLAGERTLRACIEDAFLDCPWRERGTYLGDALIEAGALRAVDPDPAVTVRCIDLWAQGQLPDGQMQACVPSWHRVPHEDFSLIWILLIHDYWAHHGDLSPAARHWDVAERILASSAYRRGESGLITGRGTHAFIDWGGPRDRADLDDHACLNAYYHRALVCAADLAQALGRAHRAEELRAEVKTSAQRFQSVLWNPDLGRFHAGTRDGALCDVGERHANTLALAFGLAPEGQSGRLADYICERLQDNLKLGCEQGQGAGQLELYFFGYLLPALWQHGKAAEAEALVRSHYGLMQRSGAWTIWECFARGVGGAGSLCHAWSCAPLISFHRHILGVQPAEPGDMRRLRIRPDSALPWASGTVPHPAGSVHVAWRRDGDVVHLSVRAPLGVSTELGLGPSFAGCHLIVE